MSTANSEHKGQKIVSEEDAFMAFKSLHQTQGLFQELFLPSWNTDSEDKPGYLNELIVRFKNQGGIIKCYKPGQILKTRGQSFPWDLFAAY